MPDKRLSELPSSTGGATTVGLYGYDTNGESVQVSPESIGDQVGFSGEALDAAVALASSEADRSESAADAAGIAGNQFQNTTDGLANTSASGATNRFFTVPSASDEGYVDLYLNNSGVADYVDTYPNKGLVDILNSIIKYVPGTGFVLVGSDGYGVIRITGSDIFHPKIQEIEETANTAATASEILLRGVVGDGCAIVGADKFGLIHVKPDRIIHPHIQRIDAKIDSAPEPTGQGVVFVGADNFGLLHVTPTDIKHPKITELTDAIAASSIDQLAREQSLPAIKNIRGIDRFRVSLSKAEYENISVINYGDSVTFGAYVDGLVSTPDSIADVNGWSGILRTKFSRLYDSPEANSISGWDDRVVKAGGAASGGSVGFNRRSVTLSGSAQTATWTLPSGTTIRFSWYEHDGSASGVLTGSFKYRVDGGSWNTITNGGGVDLYRSQEITGLTDTAHTVEFEWVSGSNYICSVRHHSGRGITVGRFGQSGWTSYDAFGKGVRNNLNAAGQTRMQESIWQQENPDLLIWGFGRNDCTYQAELQPDGSYPTPANYKANAQVAIDKVVAGGGCVLLLSTPAPSDDTTPGAAGYYYSDYWEANEELALANRNVATFRMVDALGLYSVQQSMGILTAAHPNRLGSGDWGRVIYNLLAERIHATY